MSEEYGKYIELLRGIAKGRPLQPLEAGILKAAGEFNPDYGDDPEVLNGALKDALESIGHLQSKLEAAEAKIKQLEDALELEQTMNAYMKRILKKNNLLGTISTQALTTDKRQMAAGNYDPFKLISIEALDCQSQKNKPIGEEE